MEHVHAVLPDGAARGLRLRPRRDDQALAAGADRAPPHAARPAPRVAPRLHRRGISIAAYRRAGRLADRPARDIARCAVPDAVEWSAAPPALVQSHRPPFCRESLLS